MELTGPKSDLSLFYSAKKAKIMKDKNEIFLDFLRPAQEGPSQTFLKWADTSSIFEKGQKSQKANYRSSHRRCSVRKGVLRNFEKFTGKHLCQSLFFCRPEACNFIKKETLAQVFSCEFSKISKNTFFYRTPLGDCFCNYIYMSVSVLQNV